MKDVRQVEAEYSDGMLRPSQPLTLRPGERVNLIVVRRADPSRWDLAKLAQGVDADEREITEQGLSDWSDNLDNEDRG